MGKIIAFSLIFILVFMFVFSVGTSILAFTTVRDLRYEIYTDIRNQAVIDVSIENLGYRDNISNKEKRNLVLDSLTNLDIQSDTITINNLQAYSDDDIPVTIAGDIYNEAGIWLEYTLTIPVEPFAESIDVTLEEYIEADTFLASFQ